jgi:aspartate/methionine/tyrosine aminotransferase
MIKTAARLATINEYYFSKKLKEIAEMNALGKRIINLGIGSPDLPPSLKTINKLVETAQLPQSHAYQSYVGTPQLRAAMVNFYQTKYNVSLDSANEILPLIGSKEGIMHICMTYLEAGDEALVPNPGYPTYRAAVTLAGAGVRDYELDEADGWHINFEELAQQDLSKVKIIFVNYPHMPTGATADEKFYKKLIDFCSIRNILIVNDNPYSFILNSSPPLSILSIEGAKNVALELNSLSKSHNMAGWRVGMLCGRADYLADVLRFKSNMDSGMFLALQTAAATALESGDEWFDELNATYKKRQKKAFELLKLLNCSFQTAQTGLFVWAKVPPLYSDGFQLSDEILYGSNVFLTPGGIFGSKGNGYIRISLCASETIFEEAIERVEKFLVLEVNN